MGQHRRGTSDQNGVKKQSALATDTGEGKHPKQELIEKRIGLRKQVCQDCNARLPQSAEKCRKCGSKQLRRKNTDFK